MVGRSPLLPEAEAAEVQSFRSTERTSMARANLFALECVVIMAGYALVLMMPGLVREHVPSAAAASRAWMLMILGAIYLLRLNVMARWLLPRELAMEELTVVPLWIASILASYSLTAILCTEAISPPAMLLSALFYFLGSWLNTWSELQRKWWKAKPENKGRCYTLGLFSLSRNINYLGDVVLFTGWAGVTGNWWNAWVPLVMAASFYFVHIPDKEKYLRERYREDWPEYERSVKSLIPHIC